MWHIWQVVRPRRVFDALLMGRTRRMGLAGIIVLFLFGMAMPVP
jgi:hypothetical protein